LAAYVAFRHEAVIHLVSVNPTRTIEAVVAPAEEITPSNFAREVACECRVTRMVVDWWGPNGWVMATGGGFEDQHLEFTKADLDREFAQRADLVLDEYPDLDLTDLRMTVRNVRLELESEAALTLMRNSLVWSVDPLSDIADHYRGVAANVEVSNAPDLFVVHGEEELGLSWAVGHWPE
jgi:hypothetical protein